MFADKKNIFDFTKLDLEKFIKIENIKSFRTNQIWNWLYVQGVKSFRDMKNLPTKVQDMLDKKLQISLLEVEKSYTSEDGTKKWIFKLQDGKEIETVFIPEAKRGTICVSSQVGCALSCSFCHTGTMKLERNLELREIIGQIITVKYFLNDWKKKNRRKSYH